MSVPGGWLQSSWYGLEDPAAPGEHLTVSTLERRYALTWLNASGAQLFLDKTPSAGGMRPARLETVALKESYLRAVQLLGATDLLMNYQPGGQPAMAIPLPEALRLLSLH